MSQSDPSLSSETEKTSTANTYHLQCTDCSFETTVEGDAMETLDVADEHTEEHGGVAMDHFVDVHMVKE